MKSVLRTQMFLLTPSICHSVLQSPSHPFRRQLSISAFQSDKSLSSISVFSSVRGAAAAAQSVGTHLLFIPHVPHLAVVQIQLQNSLRVPLWSVCQEHAANSKCRTAAPTCLQNSNSSCILTASMSWRKAHFLRKHFLAFWKKFFLLRTDVGWNKNVSCPMFTIPVPEECVFPRSIHSSLTETSTRASLPLSLHPQEHHLYPLFTSTEKTDMHHKVEPEQPARGFFVHSAHFPFS